MAGPHCPNGIVVFRFWRIIIHRVPGVVNAVDLLSKHAVAMRDSRLSSTLPPMPFCGTRLRFQITVLGLPAWQRRCGDSGKKEHRNFKESDASVGHRAEEGIWNNSGRPPMFLMTSPMVSHVRPSVSRTTGQPMDLVPVSLILDSTIISLVMLQ